MMDNLERRLIIEQTKKEVLDEIKKYLVGFALDGDMMATKTATWQGHIFVIPDEKYRELFKED